MRGFLRGREASFVALLPHLSSPTEPQVGWAAWLCTRRAEPRCSFLSMHLETDPQPSRSPHPRLTSQLTSSAFLATPGIRPVISLPSPVPILKVVVKPFSSFSLLLFKDQTISSPNTQAAGYHETPQKSQYLSMGLVFSAPEDGRNWTLHLDVA